MALLAYYCNVGRLPRQKADDHFADTKKRVKEELAGHEVIFLRVVDGTSDRIEVVPV